MDHMKTLQVGHMLLKEVRLHPATEARTTWVTVAACPQRTHENQYGVYEKVRLGGG